MDKKSQNLNFFVLKMIRYASGFFMWKFKWAIFVTLKHCVQWMYFYHIFPSFFAGILYQVRLVGNCEATEDSDDQISTHILWITRDLEEISKSINSLRSAYWRQIIFPIKESRRQLLLYFTKKRYCIYVLSMRQREEIEDQLYQWSCDATIRILRIWWIRKISFFSSRFWEEEEMFSCNGSRLMAYEQFKLISDLLPSLLFLLPSGIIASFMYFLFASFSDVTFCELQVLLFQVGLLRSI